MVAFPLAARLMVAVETPSFVTGSPIVTTDRSEDSHVTPSVVLYGVRTAFTWMPLVAACPVDGM